MSINKVNNLKQTLSALYGLSKDELMVHFYDLNKVYPFITDTDPLDLDLWELLESHLSETLESLINPVSIQDKLEIIKTESISQSEKREDKNTHKNKINTRTYIDICSKKKAKSANKLNKNNTVKNSSIGAVKQDNPILSNNYLYNLDRATALLFINDSKAVIWIRKQTKTQVKLGYFLDLYPNYNYSFDISKLSSIEVIKLTSFISELRDNTLSYGDIATTGNKKISDLRVWLHLTGHTSENNALFHEFDLWIGQKSFKAIENWIFRKKKQLNITKPIVWYKTQEDGENIIDKHVLFKLWSKDYELKSISSTMKVNNNTLRSTDKRYKQ